MSTTLKVIQIVFLLGFLSSCGSDSLEKALSGGLIDADKYGSLTVSGADTGETGTTFSAATYETTPLLNFTAVAWGDATLDLGFSSAGLVAVTFDSSSAEVVSVTMINTIDDRDWTYTLGCKTVSCPDISVNLTTKQVTFSGLTIPVDLTEPLNQASGSVTLNGTLTYVN